MIMNCNRLSPLSLPFGARKIDRRHPRKRRGAGNGRIRMVQEWMPQILEARRRISAHLSPTPLHYYPLLSELLGAEVHVKHENFQPIGAFKVRGGINLMACLP